MHLRILRGDKQLQARINGFRRENQTASNGKKTHAN
jgi:hypothetical protein